MKHAKEWIIMASMCSLLALVSGCIDMMETGFVNLGMLSDRGDKWIAELQVGMTKSEVEAAINVSHTTGRIAAADYDRLFDWGMEVVPYDLSKKAAEGTEVWDYDYWVNSNTVFHLNVFFTADGRVMGWVKPYSTASAEKYKHEKLTSKIRNGMGQVRLKQLLGEPMQVKLVPQQREPSLYFDHYWTKDPANEVKDAPMWVYSYSTSGEKIRNVYIFFDNKDRIYGWGYDHAHEEADRYLQRTTRKSK